MKKDKNTREEAMRGQPQSWIEQKIIQALTELKGSIATTEERIAEIKVLRANYTSIENLLAESEKRRATLEETIRTQMDRILKLERQQKEMEAEITTMASEFESACGSLEKLASALKTGSV